MTEHSPLPWTVLACGTHIVDPHAWTVASTHFGGSADQAEANGRLIVRAVNSRDALLAAAKYTVAVLDGEKPKDFEPDQPFDLVTLKSAIAAAEELAP